MILSFFRNLRAKIIGAKVGNFVSLDRRGNFVDSGLGPSDLNSPLPEVTSSDNGKVLKVISGDWGKGSVREVPTGGTQGQVLTKNSSGFGWADPTGGSKLYLHTIFIPSDENKGEVVLQLLLSTQQSIVCISDLWDLMPTHLLPCTGWFFYDSANVRTTASTIQRSSSSADKYVTVSAPLHTGESMPMFFNFSDVNTYNLTVYVDEIG